MLFPRKTLLILMAALAAGCSTSGTDKPQETAEAAPSFDGRCNADNVSTAVGQQASADLLEQSRVKAGAQVARVLRPHDMVTLEYRSDRLNLNTDDAGKVTRVNCG